MRESITRHIGVEEERRRTSDSEFKIRELSTSVFSSFVLVSSIALKFWQFYREGDYSEVFSPIKLTSPISGSYSLIL
jgi:hypothetical protein